MLKRSISKLVAIALLAILIISGAWYMVIYKKAAKGISAPFVISPDGNRLAMTIGSRLQKYPFVVPIKKQVYVLNIGKEASELNLVPESSAALAMAWRPGALPLELFAAILPLEPDRPPRIFAVTVSDDASTIFSKILPDNLRIARMAWNPSGDILAAVVLNDKGVYLGISYDNGNNFTITDIAISGGRVIWTNDETLYVQHGNDILEVDVSDRNPRLRRTLVSAEGVYLSGSLYGRAVYRLGNEIYCGDQLLYKASQKIRQVIADGSYIAFQAGSYVWVLDGRGNLKSKKSIERDTTKLIAISSVHKFVYLVKNQQSIERYNFVNGDEISTVFDVGILK